MSTTAEAMRLIAGGAYVRVVHQLDVQLDSAQSERIGTVGIVDGGSAIVSRVVFADGTVLFFDDASLETVSELCVPVAERVRLLNAAERVRNVVPDPTLCARLDRIEATLAEIVDALTRHT